ncbi:hypothetical protein [Demequina muriae]|uniref:Uncharacterized protein n=1 Tax=Demequina muriae TaxID=3051664 RepID=A0ABT8GEQ4_9MICO|nr:hypothetical protein [Demequina sp. EGI L300058]MDN4479912.1 hypothetical protein [Demequina sp. EGI L300058]
MNTPNTHRQEALAAILDPLLGDAVSDLEFTEMVDLLSAPARDAA